MNRTKIEWVRNPDGSPGYTFNPITGCLNNCPYCYARKLANGRLKTRYLANKNVASGIIKDEYDWNRPIVDPFYPRFWPDKIRKPVPTYMRYGASRLLSTKQTPKGIFVCNMGDLFGIGVPEEWTKKVLTSIKQSDIHRFYLLTKQPQNLIKFSPFPENCLVGASATNWLEFSDTLGHLASIEAKVKYISFEPLLGEIKLDMLQQMLFPKVVNWVIIGSCTGTKPELEALIKRYPALSLMPFGKKWTAQPKIDWVREIVEAADHAGVPVFLKDNLKPLLDTLVITGGSFGRLTRLKTNISRNGCRKRGWYQLRQEMPKTHNLTGT